MLPDFYIVPRIVRETDGLKPSDWMVYAAIYWFTKLKGERCFASNETIGKAAGVSRATARDSISRMAKKGLLQVILDGRKHRVEILAKVSFNLGGVSSTDEGGVVNQRQGVSSTDEQNKNNRKRITNTLSPDGDRGQDGRQSLPGRKVNGPASLVERYFLIRGTEPVGFPSHLPAAKRLLKEADGDVALAARWLDDIGAHLEGLVSQKRIKSWRIDAVLKNLSDYFAGNL